MEQCQIKQATRLHTDTHVDELGPDILQILFIFVCGVPARILHKHSSSHRHSLTAEGRSSIWEH